MKIFSLLLCISIGHFCWALQSHDELGSISGVVSDDAGNRLPGVMITLAGKQTDASNQAITGISGEYKITNLSRGKYKVRAELAAFQTAESEVSVGSDPAQWNISLSRLPAPAAQDGTPHPGLQFQASGIHGLIDPGGYSASATAAAATGVLRGIANIKRTSKSEKLASANEWPCSLEPKLRQALDDASHQAEANQRLGLFYIAHGQPAKATPLLKRAVELNAADWTAQRGLAVALLLQGQFDAARELLKPLAEGQTSLNAHDRAEQRLLLARADEGLGQFHEAAQEYSKADSYESSEEAQFGIGYELLLAGSPSDALAVFQSGARKFPNSVSLRIGAGTAQFLAGRAAEGLHNFLDAADLDPSDPRPYSFLTAASAISGEEHERVRVALKRFLDRSPNDASANFYYASMLAHEGDGSEASRIEALLKRAIQLDPKLAKAHLQLADQYSARLEYKEAIPEYEAALQLSPNLSEAHYRLAMAYKRSGSQELAAHEMQTFQQAKAGESSANGTDGVDLAQFISVMDSEPESAAADTSCKEVVH